MHRTHLKKLPAPAALLLLAGEEEGVRLSG
jgi:hypothetical protein